MAATGGPGQDDSATADVANNFARLAGAIAVGDKKIRDLPPTPVERPVDVDRVRRNLAYIALGLFGVTIVFGFIGAIWSAEAWERTKAFLQIVIPVETLLIGGTSGHYFGHK